MSFPRQPQVCIPLGAGVVLIAGLVIGARGVSAVESPLPLDQSLNTARVVQLEKGDPAVVMWRSSVATNVGAVSATATHILLGSNNSFLGASGASKDLGTVIGFRRMYGVRLWQFEHPRLPSRINDIPLQSIRSIPAVSNEDVFYFSNRGELVSVSLKSGRRKWALDLVGTQNVLKRDAGDVGNPSPSPFVWKDFVFCATANGTLNDRQGVWVPHPEAPGFVAVDRSTGRLVWKSTVANQELMYSHWGSPSMISVGKVTQVVFPGGDGFLHGFDPETGRLEWSLDCNSPTATQWTRRRRGTRCYFNGRPVVAEEALFVALGQEPESGGKSGEHRIVAVDLRPIGEKQPPRLHWGVPGPGSAQIRGDLCHRDRRLYALSGVDELLVLDATNGETLFARCVGEGDLNFGWPVIARDRLWVPTSEALLIQRGFDDASCCCSRVPQQRGRHSRRGTPTDPQWNDLDYGVRPSSQRRIRSRKPSSCPIVLPAVPRVSTLAERWGQNDECLRGRRLGSEKTV